jgi:hypothetical protein
MILEYSYDNGNMILDYFKQSKLATLDIKTVRERRPDGDVKFVMEYTLVEEYPELRQELIKEVLADSLPERLQLANVLNKFIENQILDNVNDFSLKFNAVQVRKCEITYSSSYKQAVKDTNLTQELIKCLEKYDRIVTEMGIADQPTKNLFKREGSGRNKKYTLATIQEVGNALRQSLMEE